MMGFAALYPSYDFRFKGVMPAHAVMIDADVSSKRRD
jgi:hypothetical protein